MTTPGAFKELLIPGLILTMKQPQGASPKVLKRIKCVVETVSGWSWTPDLSERVLEGRGN